VSIPALATCEMFTASMEENQMFENVLVATDGSDHARRATEVACDLAARYGARLVILHVVGDGKVPERLARMLEVEHLTEGEHPKAPNVANVVGGIATVERGTDSKEHEMQMKEAIAEILLERAERTAKSKDVSKISRITEYGDPVDRILECANRENADLIIMGTRGLSDLRGLLMGSVSHKICQLSRCTCVTVK
jgi:nucleotide-binding universal stress UspA family protein